MFAKNKYRIGQGVTIHIDRQEANFDRACDEAIYRALRLFGVDDCGHINNVEGAQRSDSSVEIKFVEYQVGLSMVNF